MALIRTLFKEASEVGTDNLKEKFNQLYSLNNCVAVFVKTKSRFKRAVANTSILHELLMRHDDDNDGDDDNIMSSL